MEITNKPAWPQANLSLGFQEVWYLKLVEPKGQRALWLRFTLLNNPRLSKQEACIWAIFFKRSSNHVEKFALKETLSSDHFKTNNRGFRMGDHSFSDQQTSGKIKQGKQEIEWSLAMCPRKNLNFDFVPSSLARLRLVKNYAVTVQSDLHFNGWVKVNGESFQWQNAPGMQGHLFGQKNGYAWAWAHGNCFVDSRGAPVDFVFEGLTAQARLANRYPSPYISSFFIVYQGRPFYFNRIRDSIFCHSRFDYQGWEIKLRSGDLEFHLHIQSQPHEFAGLTYEDTDGSLIYCSNSKLSSMKVQIFRQQKLEVEYTAPHTVAYEVASRTKPTDIEFLL